MSNKDTCQDVHCIPLYLVEKLLQHSADRLAAAEAVIEDAERDLGVVNPLLVNVWRELAGKQGDTSL